MKYGPETETIEAFLRHLKQMTPEQWDDVPAAWRAVWETAMAAAGMEAYYAARRTVWDVARDMDVDSAAGTIANFAVNEIQGGAIMRERNQPFYFLNMFGFADPEAVLAADQASK